MTGWSRSQFLVRKARHFPELVVLVKSTTAASPSEQLVHKDKESPMAVEAFTPLLWSRTMGITLERLFVFIVHIIDFHVISLWHRPPCQSEH
jgi:hypothetical protein